MRVVIITLAFWAVWQTDLVVAVLASAFIIAYAIRPPRPGLITRMWREAQEESRLKEDVR